MKKFDSLKQALYLSSLGIESSPLAPNSKVPLKGSHGYLDATNDKAKLNRMFQSVPNANLCVRLDNSHLILIDVDTHSETADGKRTLIKLLKDGKKLPTDTYVESSPNNGVHYYFSVAVPVNDITDAFGKNSGIEIKTKFSSVYPSEINDKQYTPLDGHTFADVKPAPMWLLEYMQGQTSHSVQYAPRRKGYTGSLLDNIVAGAPEHKRNIYLTKLAGTMFATGANPETVYQLLNVANDCCTTPLPNREVKKIFMYLVHKEARKIAG